MRPRRKNKNPAVLIFSLFIFFAICVVLLLEYIDFHKGKKSILFKNVEKNQILPDKQDQFNQALTRILNHGRIGYDYTVKEEALHFKIEADSKKIDSLIRDIKEMVSKMQGHFSLAEVQDSNDSLIRLFKVEFGRSISHWLLISKPKKTVTKKRPAKKVSSRPKIAFIIDDIGNRPNVAKTLKKLNIPITGSVLPHTPFALEEAEYLKSVHLETILHLPMQPKNSRSSYPRDRYITINSSDTEIRSLIKRARAIAPHSLGCNNHEGSLITSNEKIIRRFLKIIKSEGLFFIDSRTTTNTIAYDLARELGVKTTRRDVFLDDPHTYENSMNEIKRLVEIALRKKKAVAIGHPFTSTLQAIYDSISYIRSRGIEIVFVSKLLE